MDDTSKQMAVVEVKSAWFSKINWTQAVSLLATLLAIKGIDLDPTTRVAIVAAIQSITVIITWVLRTWFNSTVSPASISPANTLAQSSASKGPA